MKLRWNGRSPLRAGAALVSTLALVQASACDDDEECVEQTDVSFDATPDRAVLRPEDGDFGDRCSLTGDCQSTHCLFEASVTSTGFCSMICEDSDECPDAFQCSAVAGSSANFCVPEVEARDCFDACSEYDDLTCLTTSDAYFACQDVCEEATFEARETFVDCVGPATPACNLDCLEAFAPGIGPFVAPVCEPDNG